MARNVIFNPVRVTIDFEKSQFQISFCVLSSFLEVNTEYFGEKIIVNGK